MGRRSKLPFIVVDTARSATVRHVHSSTSGTTVNTSEITIQPPPPQPSEPPEVMEEIHHSLEPQIAKRSEVADEPFNQWKPLRDEFLQELLRNEGRGDALNVSGCPDCKAPGMSGVYRCDDCFGAQLVCASCCVERHVHNPLHNIRKWNGATFERSALHQLGLCIQLNHSHPDVCAVSHPSTLTIMHTNGIHIVNVRYCDCSRSMTLQHRQQLLRREWFPATVVQPQTCATFQLLRHFHIQTLQSKISAYHFYCALERETDNTGLVTIYTRYSAFLRMVREWRHLKMLKRAGRAHDVTGVSGTQVGELAVWCPACPHPNINLPLNWESEPSTSQFRYWLILAVDANFRLKNRLGTGDDPGLGTGLAYFVENDEYKTHLLKFTEQKDISTCSGLAALDLANSKSSKGLRATGVGASVCARHGLILPNGLGDLQKGERYSNMDYIIASSLRRARKIRHLVISYDIACQWDKNFIKTRHARLPSHLQLDLSNVTIDTAVPKFHLPAHGQKCHTMYSLNFRPGVGRTDGEGIERDWSAINPAANSTKEMGEGSRHDALDDFWGDWNYRKVTTMGTELRRKLKLALSEASTHVAQYTMFTASMSPATIEEWEKMVVEWEADRNKWPDPYALSSTHKSQSQVRLELIEAEHAQFALGSSETHELSISAFISLGLEIEDLQRRLRRDVDAKSTRTDAENIALETGRVSLRRRITAFRRAQLDHMPSVRAHLVDTDDQDDIEAPELASLLLPSELPSGYQTLDWFKALRTTEYQLRRAQAFDALVELRQSLSVRAHLTKYKNKDVRGQRSNTRARALLDRSFQQTELIAGRYRRAREAILDLVGPGEWENALQVLAPNDVRPLSEAEEQRFTQSGPHEGYRTLSWIWIAKGIEGGGGDEVHEALRIEWTKCRARKERWCEELILLREEMRRVLVSCEYGALVWDRRSQSCISHDLVVQEGLRSYAVSQAGILRQRAAHFWTLWIPYYATGASPGDSTLDVAAQSQRVEDDDDDEDS